MSKKEWEAMITITKPEQVKEINWQENKAYYIYGKIGCGKTHMVKEIVRQYQQKRIDTNFSKIIEEQNKQEKQEQKEKGIIVIDEEIKSIMKKQLVSITIERALRKMQEEGNTILILNTVTPKELEKIDNSLANFLLSCIPIEICYDEESRIKIAEEYSKQCHTTISRETLKKMVEKEENLGKIRGKVNLISINY